MAQLEGLLGEQYDDAYVAAHNQIASEEASLLNEQTAAQAVVLNGQESSPGATSEITGNLVSNESGETFRHAHSDGREFSGTLEQARKICPALGKMSYENARAALEEFDLAARIAQKGREQRMAEASKETRATNEPKQTEPNSQRLEPDATTQPNKIQAEPDTLKYAKETSLSQERLIREMETVLRHQEQPRAQLKKPAITSASPEKPKVVSRQPETPKPAVAVKRVVADTPKEHAKPNSSRQEAKQTQIAPKASKKAKPIEIVNKTVKAKTPSVARTVLEAKLPLKINNEALQAPTELRVVYQESEHPELNSAEDESSTASFKTEDHLIDIKEDEPAVNELSEQTISHVERVELTGENNEPDEAIPSIHEESSFVATAAVKELETVFTKLSEVVEKDVDGGVAEKVSEIMKVVTSLPIEFNIANEDKEKVITKELEKLVVQLFESTGVEYTPKLLKSFIELVKDEYYGSLFEEMGADDEASIAALPSEAGTHEFLQKVRLKLVIMRRSFTNFYNLGRSVMRLYRSS